MSRDPHSHLSAEELAWLAEAESADRSRPNSDRDMAEAHADGCGACGSRLREQRSAQASLGSMASTVASERTHGCPEEEKWMALAAGLCSAAEATPLLTHASGCNHCGHLLREATEDLNPEISAEEQELIRQLPSTRASWQRDVARKMAEMSGATRTSSIPGARKTRPHVAMSFAAWKRWGVPVTAAAVLALAVALWIERSPSLSSTNQLIAQAYTAQRPVELRFPGAGYGPVRQERGNVGQHRSRMDEPPELLEAETQIARGLARHPHDAGWLQAKARTDLFEGSPQTAIEMLRQVEDSHPENLSVKLDLAIAYYERAGTHSEPAAQVADYSLALQSLNEVLSKNPNDLVALFNRAMVRAQLKKYAESTSDWQRYLQLDPTGEWAEVAKRQLDLVRKSPSA